MVLFDTPTMVINRNYSFLQIPFHYSERQATQNKKKSFWENI